MTPPERPTGEVAFLFTDIEGSTRLVQELGTAAWRPLLERHRVLVREAVQRHGGAEQGTEGDSFFVVFRDPRAAVGTAADAQRALAAEPWPDGVAIRVRAGIHVGTGELDGDGSYVGHDVHRAARVAGAAHGGQVLLSEAAADLVAAALPDGVGLRSLGAHRLKDLRPERIDQLVIDGLDADFPPIRSLDARPNNLPVQLTAFVGRERELEELRAIVDRARLVTLTGPGGTGKSRLALHLAASVADRFPDGIWFVPLAAVVDPELVPASIAGTIGIRENPNRPRMDVIAEELDGKRTLLVLDNLEQLGRSGPSLADLLRRLPQLAILATSRSPLHVAGEQEYPVPGLPSPLDLELLSPYERERLAPSLRARTAEAIAGYEAVQLFVARAASVRPGFALTDANAPDIALITTHLGGVPLAIELAAARIRFLTPAAIHERLEGRLDQAGGGAADAPERQQSLRAAITWSYDLLEPPVRRLFERLAVFMGGFDVTCAEAVAGSRDDLGMDALDGLAALVDQSLLSSNEVSGEPRFSFLEPIREFAAERLAASGEGEDVGRRHAVAFHHLALDLQRLLTGESQRVVLDRLELEHANLRSAIDWADEHAEAALALETASAIWRFWQKRGHLVEARRRLDTLIGRGWFTGADPTLRARAHEARGGVAYWHGDFAGARPDYEAALAIWREIANPAEIANALYNLSFCFTLGGRGLDVDHDTALGLLTEALTLFRSVGDDRGIANAQWGIGVMRYFSGSNEPAADALEEALMLYRRVGDRTQEGWALHQLGATRLKLGQVAEAKTLIRDSLRMFGDAGDVSAMTLVVDDLASVATAEGDVATAARLQGLSLRLQATTGARLAETVEGRFEAMTRPNVAVLLSESELERYHREGASLPLEIAVAFALGDLDWEHACAAAGLDVEGRLQAAGIADERGPGPGAAPR